MSKVESLISLDPYLKDYAQKLRDRCAHYRWMLDRLQPTGGLLGMVSHGHHYFGFNRGTLHEEPGIWYREWVAGGATAGAGGRFQRLGSLDRHHAAR